MTGRRAIVLAMTMTAGLAAVPATPLMAEAPAAEAAASAVKAGVDAWTLGDYAGAVKAWQGPAAAGDADAQFNLAQAYRLGQGAPRDMAQAEDWYRRAAQQGHLEASDNYGLLMFQDGRHKEALPWIAASADRGEPRAQYVLGIASFNGDVVGKDWVRAYALMTRAAASGLPAAVSALQAMDKSIPLAQRQMGVSLASDLERAASANRDRQLAGAELGAPLRPSPAPTPVATTAVPPSSAVTTADAAGPMTAGADYANPVTLPPPGGTKVAPRVVGSYITGAPAPASTTAPAQTTTPEPAIRPAPKSEPKPAPKPAARPAPTGNWRIQLGAFGQKANADALWNRVKGLPALAGRSRFDLPSGAVSRLQAGPFASEAEARAACTAVIGTSGACVALRN